MTRTRLPRSIFLSIFIVIPLLGGCLTADQKEVHITINDDGHSGSCRIIFNGIASTPGDSVSAVNEDFNSLIAEYYQGRKIEMENKGMKNIRKKLFVADGKLKGEIDFDFDNLSTVGIFRYLDAGPFMYYTVSDGFLTSGQYSSSNGTYLGDKFPVIFWDSTQHNLFYRMTLSTPQEPKQSLLANYQQWQATQH